MKKSIRTMLITGIMLIFACSCTRDDMPAFPGAGEGEEVVMKLSMSAVPETQAGGSGPSGTRALGDGIEEGTENASGYIKDFWVLEYNAQGGQLGTARYFDAKIETNAIPVIKPTKPEDVYLCVFIANTHSQLLSDRMGDVSTLEKLMQAIETVRSLENTHNSNDLLMNGTCEIRMDTRELNVNMYRNVAKLTLEISSGIGSEMTLTSVQIRSVCGKIVYADRVLAEHLQENNTDIYPAAESGGFFDYKVDNILVKPGGSHTLHYYLPRNMQGRNQENDNVINKNRFAPEGATYIEILAEDRNGFPMRYTFYPGENMANDFNIIPNKHYTLKIAVNEKGNPGLDNRVEDLGRIPLGESNCYLIHPLASEAQTVYCVPGVLRSNLFWGGNAGADPGNVIGDSDEWVAEVIWQDQGRRLICFCDEDGSHPDSITGPAGNYFNGSGKNYFFFKPVMGAEGNVLVGIRKKSEESKEYNKREYLWSFHLWITGYDPAYTNDWTDGQFSYKVVNGNVHRYADITEEGIWKSNYTNRYMMDRHIGAYANNSGQYHLGRIGMYYQYGRKDPFPHPDVELYDIVGGKRRFGDDSNIAKAEGPANLAQAVKHPYTFYYSATGKWNKEEDNPYASHNWYNPVNDSEKSLFDPSPYGWCLPNSSIWEIFRDNSGKSNALDRDNYGNGYNYYIDNVYDYDHAPGNTTYYPISGHYNGNHGKMESLNYGRVWGRDPRILAFQSSGTSYANLIKGTGAPVRSISMKGLKEK